MGRTPPGRTRRTVIDETDTSEAPPELARAILAAVLDQIRDTMVDRRCQVEAFVARVEGAVAALADSGTFAASLDAARTNALELVAGAEAKPAPPNIDGSNGFPAT